MTKDWDAASVGFRSSEDFSEYLKNAEAARTQPAQVPQWLTYDADTDVLTIHGKRYSAGMFGEEGFLSPVGTLLRVEAGVPDVVTLTKMQIPRLTAEEIGKAYASTPWGHLDSQTKFARAIEAALIAKMGGKT